MRRLALITCLFAIVHALICLWLIPRTNTAFQWWFDTGEPMSKFDSVGHLIAILLSFPLVTWAMMLHPSRVDWLWLVGSVSANSFLWATCLCMLLALLGRRREVMI